MFCTVAGILFCSHLGGAHAGGESSGDVARGGSPVRNAERDSRGVSSPSGSPSHFGAKVGIRAHDSDVHVTGESFSNKFFGIHAENGRAVDAANITLKDAHAAIHVGGGSVSLRDSNIQSLGHHNFGIVGPVSSVGSADSKGSFVTLTNTKLHLDNSVGILGRHGRLTVTLRDSHVDTDVLVKRLQPHDGENRLSLSITSSNSSLRGGVKTILAGDNFDEIIKNETFTPLPTISAQGRDVLPLVSGRQQQEAPARQVDASGSPGMRSHASAETNRPQITPNERSSGARVHSHGVSGSSSRSVSGNLVQNGVVLNLHNNSKWTLTVSKREMSDSGEFIHRKPEIGLERRATSDLSVLNIRDSSVVFEAPKEGVYQKLYVGYGNPGTRDVYSAQGDARLHLNVEVNDGHIVGKGKHDQVIIRGDVSGKTVIHVKSVDHRKEKKKREAVVHKRSNVTCAMDVVSARNDVASLVRVFGKVEKDSFQLKNGYTTFDGLPYKYVLTVHKSELKNDVAVDAPSGKDPTPIASPGKVAPYWDFRLQKGHLVPQAASYLVVPGTLFFSGFTDAKNQNMFLNDIWTMPSETGTNGASSFFLSSYGGKGTLSSDRTPHDYSHGADVRYGALQTGVVFAKEVSQNTDSRFGILGTYGRLSFIPADMEDAAKSTLNKWSLTAYGSLQHDTGLYANLLLSYGVLKGDIANAIEGKTASLDNAKALSASAVIGREIKTDIKSLTVRPEAQIVYQRFSFKEILDLGGFEVDMLDPYQWLLNIGGRLTKTVSLSDELGDISLYGKMYLIKSFGETATMRMGDVFHLDTTGSSVEGGVGIDAKIMKDVTFHADVSHRFRLQETGVSGTSFSGGIRYRF